jgi:predicted SprT family Zn-dependent metalloprotease
MKRLDDLKMKVWDRIHELNKKTTVIYGVVIPNVEVKYDLAGTRVAGMAVTIVEQQKFIMHLHEAALLEYSENYIEETVVHEFAHLVQDLVWGETRSHGREWKNVMKSFGAKPDRCHSMDLSNALMKLGKITGTPGQNTKQKTT